jgi:dTDP-6-deoxy-L-talose 4-dehydrogenase (NAD+)
MKVAVTGASGFIGRHVLAELLERPVEIVAVTRDAGHLIDFAGRVSIVCMDLGDVTEGCFHLLGRPDVLIHLAWSGLPNYKSLHHFETELPRQYRFLKTLVEGELRSLVVTGTCFEYGMQSGVLSEDLPTMPNNPYGHAKDALRRQLEFLQTVRSFNFTWARLFYVYGNGQAPGALYPQLKQAVLRGDRQFNLSGGEQLRDYLPVEEIAGCLVALGLRRSNAGVVNVCSGKPVSVRTLVETWLNVNHWKIKLNFGYYPYPDYEPMAFWGDRSRLNAILRDS